MKGQVSFTQNQGNYVLLARYQDKGGLVGQDLIRLYPNRFNAAEADRFEGVARRNGNGSASMNYNENGSWICFKNLDLTGLTMLRANLRSPGLTGVVEVRTKSPAGPLIGQFPVESNTAGDVAARLTATPGTHDLFLIYREKAGSINIWKRLEMNWIEAVF